MATTPIPDDDPTFCAMARLDPAGFMVPGARYPRTRSCPTCP